MKENIKEKILKKIDEYESDYVFIANDFFDIASYQTIRVTLNRMVDSNEIKRIINGIYYKPKYIEIIDEYKSPNINEVANAIARKYNWNIAPSGNTALNILGLDTQVPAKWTYISDGRYVTYNFNGITIEFKRKNNAEISNMTKMTAIVIQAIKTIGKDKVSEKQINHLKQILTIDEKENLILESKCIAVWIYEILKKICEE